MQDQGNSGSVPQGSPQAGPRVVSSLFSDTSFPTQKPAPAPVERQGSGSRLLLPIVLFVVAISGLAWVGQYLPSWRSKPQQVAPPKPPDGATNTGLLEFKETVSVWDPEDPRYAREYERGQKGFYDYPFKNLHDGIVELGILRTSCDCSKVEVAVFPAADMNWQKYQEERKTRPIAYIPPAEYLPWKLMPMDEHECIEVPKGHQGIVRLSWQGKKSEGEQLRLTLTLWAQPKGQQSARDFGTLETQVVISSPLRFMHEAAGKISGSERVSVGVLAARDVGKATFYCWSATRPKLDLKVAKDKVWENSPYKFNVERLSATDAAALEKKLRDAPINTRVQAAYRVSVQIHESKMDQGPFLTNLPLVYDGEIMDGGPVVSGHVRGEIQVGLSEAGKVELPTSFLVKDGARHAVPLTAEGKVELTYESHHPTYLEVKLEKNAKESTAERTRWNLEVRVPPGFAQPGPMPPNSAVILRLGGPQGRIIRIPVTGNAVQG